jgi:D-tyrosyl-tRNA(Tyr) deacylase
MRAVAQRVAQARVDVDGQTVGHIEQGLLVYLGCGKGDGDAEVAWMAGKLTALRVFSDAEGKMNLDVRDVAGSVLVVSQFTLYGDVRKGRRPSFDAAAAPELAERLYDALCVELRRAGVAVQTGRFRASMDVHAVVAGPVTILIDSERAF